MTPARAQYLWQTRGWAGAMRLAYVPTFCMHDSPTHPDGLTEAEDREVKGFWRRMREGRRDGGGNTCWSDAFWRIMRGIGPNEPCGSCSPYQNYGDRGIADATVAALKRDDQQKTPPQATGPDAPRER